VRTSDLDHPDAAAVWAAVHEVYAGYLTGDPARGDAHLHPEVTLWDSAAEPLVLGLDGLARLRRGRPAPDAGGPVVTAIEAGDPLFDLLGDLVVLRHRLTVRFSAGADERVRNTSVWRRADGRWLMLHNHEDVVA
jgi:ketosteroid isomerase-like protein